MVHTDNQRLIEHGFPCHQVGAETQREQSVGLQPPNNRLHVWWARRPLTPSRAAILASFLPANANLDQFLLDLGIARFQAVVNGRPWPLYEEKLLKRVETTGTRRRLSVDKSVRRWLEEENVERDKLRSDLEQMKSRTPDLAGDA